MNWLMSILTLGLWRWTVPCYAIDCNRKTKDPKVFCKKHWDALPWVNQVEVFDAYDPDQEARHRRPKEFYMAVVRAVNILGIMEGKLTYEQADEREQRAEEAYRRQYEGDMQ